MGKWFNLTENHNKRSFDFRPGRSFLPDIPGIIWLVIAFLVFSVLWEFRDKLGISLFG